MKPNHLVKNTQSPTIALLVQIFEYICSRAIDFLCRILRHLRLCRNCLYHCVLNWNRSNGSRPFCRRQFPDPHCVFTLFWGRIRNQGVKKPDKKIRRGPPATGNEKRKIRPIFAPDFDTDFNTDFNADFAPAKTQQTNPKTRRTRLKRSGGVLNPFQKTREIFLECDLRNRIARWRSVDPFIEFCVKFCSGKSNQKFRSDVPFAF